MEETIENSQTYIDRIRLHEKDPLVRRVLAGKSTFGSEVEGFYGITRHYMRNARGMEHYEFRSGEGSPEKQGRFPNDLINILGGIGNESLEGGKLEYGSVRTDKNRWNDSTRSAIQGGIVLGGMMGALALINFSLQNYGFGSDSIPITPDTPGYIGKLATSIISAIGGAGMFGATCKLYESEITTCVYGDKTAQFIWSKPYFVVLIESKSVARSNQKIFDYLWKMAKK